MDKISKADVVPIRQTTQYNCMSASMGMALRANGVAPEECTTDLVNRVMGARAMQGASWEDAIACAQHYGMRATLICPATVHQLKEYTDRGIPVMIAWNPEGREWSHASVVFDIDSELNVYVADPNISDPDETVRIVPKGDFYQKWAEKWPNYLVRRPAMAIEREITPDGRQVVASTTEKPMSTFAENYPSIHPTVEAMLRQAKPALSKDDIEKALKGAGLDYKYTASDGGSFLIRGLGPMLSDAVDIELDSKGGSSKDATRWKINLKRGTKYLESRSDLSRVVSDLKKAKDDWDAKNKRASENPWNELGAIHPAVEHLVSAKDAENGDDGDKEGKFEKGKSVPLSEMPKELAENAKNPPPAAQKLKEKLKSKKASEIPARFTFQVEANFNPPEVGDIIDMGEYDLKVADVDQRVGVIGEETTWGPYNITLEKQAARGPGGLYGTTKSVQAACEASVRKLQKVALKLALDSVKRDSKVAEFWTDRAKKAKSGTAKMLLAALEASRKFAAERGESIEAGSDKEAATGYGYYGYRAKTANRAFTACLALKEAAGEIAADLHRRKAAEYERITGFLTQHSKKAKCESSKMLLHAYPDSVVKLASGPSDPGSVSAWLEFED